MDEPSSSKHKRSKHDPERKSKKRSKHDDDGGRKHKKSKKLRIVDDDPDDEDMWVEKNIDMDGERPLATNIPTAESLKLTSTAPPSRSAPTLPPAAPTTSTLKRDDWMLAPPTEPVLPDSASSSRTRLREPTGDDSLTEDYGEPSDNQRNLSGGVDFFSSLGTERKKKGKEEMPDPSTIVHRRELNPELRRGGPPQNDAPSPAPKQANTPGGAGSSWRMMRLRKVYETAEEEGSSIEEVARQRFESLEAFEEAKEERRILDEREGKRPNRERAGAERGREGERRFMFNDSMSSSRSSSFRRPGGAPGGMSASGPSTPAVPANKRLDSLKQQQASSPYAQRTPIPSVMTPPIGASKSRALSPSSLNRLQAKVLRAKLMGTPDADALEREYEAESRKANGADEGGVRTRVEMLPTLDGQGRIYDVGFGAQDEEKNLPGNRRKKKEEKFQSHDPKTGEILRYNANDDTTTLGDMLRQEKLGGGMADQKNLDAEFARSIMSDGKFQNDLDYIDDNAEKLGRQKMRSDAMKRQFAINDYKRTQKALAECHFCYGEDGETPPRAPVVAMGSRAYLSCTTNEELLPGHCLIVPVQHHLNMLEADDDVWDEVRNFMKCLMRMFADEDKGVIFYETVISLKGQKHTFIECVPLPWEQFEDIPQYFKESILASEAEWSQHKKLIDFSRRPGGFRRAMVPNLPYFMVQFDYKGEKGYGHVIEGTGNEQDGETEEDGGLAEGEKGGGEFRRYFAGEIVGNVLELEPRKWRRPKRIDFHSNKERVAGFRKKYDKFDWTGMLGK
ncbi:Complexed with Cdc5 protein cwf19 [Mycena kentingensis (nom. inval.)]|nr:Complexed with Cdc5 protein cwf19 [Mycena kentingensis (nom. inval.)]